MAEEKKSPPKNAAAPDPRNEALKAYHDADTREKKAQVVAKYPLLKSIYSDLNHS